MGLRMFPIIVCPLVGSCGPNLGPPPGRSSAIGDHSITPRVRPIDVRLAHSPLVRIAGPKAPVAVGEAARLGSVDRAQGLLLRSLNLRTTMLPSYSAISGSISSAVVTGSVPGIRAASTESPTIA